MQDIQERAGIMNRFNKRLDNIPAEIWSKITQIDELKGQWIGGANFAPQVLGRLRKSVLVTSAGASTRIEGARLSDEDVDKLMRGLSIQKFADRDKQKVRGYYELLEKVFDSWKHISFSEGSIKHLHKELLKYAEKDKLHRGDYKKVENKVEMIDEGGKFAGILFDTTSAYLTSKEMQELVEWAQNAFIEKNTIRCLSQEISLLNFWQYIRFRTETGAFRAFLQIFFCLKVVICLCLMFRMKN